MHGLGTLINMALAAGGGMIGLIFGKYINDRMKETVLFVTGMSVVVMGIGGCVANMMTLSEDGLVQNGTLMMVVSLVVGAVIGEALDLEGWFSRFGEYLKQKSGSQGDAGFINGFVTASCTICIGAMGILGSIQDGISGDYSTLAVKGVMDCVIVCIMASTMGKGTVFSAIPLGIYQGAITLLAFFAGGFMSDAALQNLSYVGNVLIISIGINIAFGTKIRVANILPAVVVAVLWTFLPFA